MTVATSTHTITADEFERIAAQNPDARLELIHGEIVEKMPTEEHGAIAALIAFFLLDFVRPRQSGRVAVEARFRAAGDAYNARIPDVSFILAENAGELVREGSVPRLPDLAVEVKSPDDTFSGLREKAAYYLANGTQLVWLVYPEKGLVEVYRPEADSQLLDKSDTLTGDPVLPGFSLSVAEIFTVL